MGFAFRDEIHAFDSSFGNIFFHRNPFGCLRHAASVESRPVPQVSRHLHRSWSVEPERSLAEKPGEPRRDDGCRGLCDVWCVHHLCHLDEADIEPALTCVDLVGHVVARVVVVSLRQFKCKFSRKPPSHSRPDTVKRFIAPDRPN